MLQAILAQCLTYHGIAIVERQGTIVLLGTIDAIGPHVLCVTLESRTRSVVPEIEESRHAVA